MKVGDEDEAEGCFVGESIGGRVGVVAMVRWGEEKS